MLTDALEGADLRCLTEQDAVATELLRGHHLIDHVCASRSLADRWEVSCWEPVDAEGIRMSDHPGVVVHLRAEEAASDDLELLRSGGSALPRHHTVWVRWYGRAT